jgi:hypothetical protein
MKSLMKLMKIMKIKKMMKIGILQKESQLLWMLEKTQVMTNNHPHGMDSNLWAITWTE